MPVKSIHRRYVFFRVESSFIPRDLLDEFIRIYGLIDYSLSSLRIIDFLMKEGIVIYSIGSKYVTKLVAAATILSVKSGVPVNLIGVSTTLKGGRERFLGRDSG